MSTYLWSDAITFLTSHVRGVPLSNISALSCDFINSIIWRSFPWSWALAGLTQIPLVDGTQDYSFGGSDATNLMRMTKARVIRTDVTPNQIKQVEVWKWLEPNVTGRVGFPQYSFICHERRLNKLRLETAASVMAGSTLVIDGEYQKRPTKITATSAVIVFPDQYFDVAVSGLMWLVYKFANDKRAGTAAMLDGRLQYTGQLGEFHDALLSMAEAESWGMGDQFHPESALVDFTPNSADNSLWF